MKGKHIWSKERIKVNTSKGKREIDAVRLVGSNFAYHRALLESDGLPENGHWNVTHVPSGCALSARHATNEATARRLTRVAASVGDGDMKKWGKLHVTILRATNRASAVGRFI